MSIPPEGSRKLFQVRSRGTVPLKDAKLPTDQRTSRNDLAFSPRNPFPWATECFHRAETHPPANLLGTVGQRRGTRESRSRLAQTSRRPLLHLLGRPLRRTGSVWIATPGKEQYNRNFPRACAVILRGGGDSEIRHGQGLGQKGKEGECWTRLAKITDPVAAARPVARQARCHQPEHHGSRLVTGSPDFASLASDPSLPCCWGGRGRERPRRRFRASSARHGREGGRGAGDNREWGALRARVAPPAGRADRRTRRTARLGSARPGRRCRRAVRRAHGAPGTGGRASPPSPGTQERSRNNTLSNTIFRCRRRRRRLLTG